MPRSEPAAQLYARVAEEVNAELEALRVNDLERMSKVVDCFGKLEIDAEDVRAVLERDQSGLAFKTRDRIRRIAATYNTTLV